MLTLLVNIWFFFNGDPSITTQQKLQVLSPWTEYEYEYVQVVCEGSSYCTTIIFWKTSPFNTLEPYVIERFYPAVNDSCLMIFPETNEVYFWDEHIWWQEPNGEYLKIGVHRLIKSKTDIEFYMVTPGWSPPRPTIQIQQGFPTLRDVSPAILDRIRKFWSINPNMEELG